MTVAELIEVLRTKPQDLPVCYMKYSEQVMLTADEVEVCELSVARPDGWVPSLRPDKPSALYLRLPGN